ncbi:BatA domain-containing protein [Haloferula sp. A504]|uniref:BatA domain-containing protein n=1 Tax=Haloferula sp. A504 TaxID=3373601 RepID=UPI0031BC384F|nr:BatA domain-containing protein [Verrucomicrobiaceae bacterium E54]
MSFLNPWLLLAGLGIALPILAHLLNRQKVKRTDWAAMQFLNRNVRVRSRQIRLRDLLLLILRCVALLLLVLALSRPAWTGDASWLPGERRAGVVIAIDSSFSMGEAGAGTSRFDEALKRVEVIRGEMHPGDPVTLVMLGDQHRVILRNMAYDEERFEQALQELDAGPGALELGSAPKFLADLVTDMEAPQKEVYLITDGQATDWKQPSAQLRKALADLGTQAQVFVVPVPGEAANLAVTGLELVQGVLRKGTTARYQATVRNCGPAAASNIEVQCRVDGVEIDRKNIPLIAVGASETVSLFVPFHNPGATGITAEITGDGLAADNVRRTVAVVRDRVSVLCVDGSTGDAGRVVTAALLARADGVQGEDYVVRAVPWLSLPAENLEEVDVIIFADVPEITEEQAAQLERFVRKGSGLVWFGGDNVKPAAWNKLAASGANPLLPGEIGSRVDTSDALGAGKPLDPEMPDHTVCLPLLSLPEDLFSETRILRQFEVSPRASAFPILQLAGSGLPVLLEQSLGRGQVFMFTTTADTAWNNMALTPVFPMVMQQIVTYLSGREFERPRIVGDSLTLTYVEQPDASDAVFDTPSGETITVPVREVGGQFVALLEEAPEAGYYTARVSVQAAGLPIAVNVDPRESEVACLPEAELRANLEGLGLDVVTGDAELAAAIGTTRTGRSAWRVFMMAGLAFLVIEALFANRLLTRARRRKDQPVNPVPQEA